MLLLGPVADSQQFVLRIDRFYIERCLRHSAHPS